VAIVCTIEYTFGRYYRSHPFVTPASPKKFHPSTGTGTSSTAEDHELRCRTTYHTTTVGWYGLVPFSTANRFIYSYNPPPPPLTVGWIGNMIWSLRWVCVLWLHLRFMNCSVEANRSAYPSYHHVTNDDAEDDASYDQDHRQLFFRNPRNDNKDIEFLRGTAGPASLSGEGTSVYRLDAVLYTDANLAGVWFQLRQEGTRFSSFTATSDSATKYFVELDDLRPGVYYWRVAVRKSTRYEYSPEYLFAVAGKHREWMTRISCGILYILKFSF
jgi:hypothetical protein